jgi:hypothetical protein
VPNQDPIPAPPFPFPGAGTTFQDPDLGVQDGYFTVTVPGENGPQKYAVPTEPVLDALQKAGVTLRFQAPEQTANGIIAGSYIVSYTLPAPPANSYYNGPTSITQTTAYGLANVNLTPTGNDLPLGVPGASAPTATAPGLDAAAAPGLLPNTDLGAVPATAPAALDLPSADQVRFAARFPRGHGVDELYLAVLGLTVAGLLGWGAIVRFGVRSS